MSELNLTNQTLLNLDASVQIDLMHDPNNTYTGHNQSRVGYVSYDNDRNQFATNNKRMSLCSYKSENNQRTPSVPVQLQQKFWETRMTLEMLKARSKIKSPQIDRK